MSGIHCAPKTATDPDGNFVIDTSNNPSGAFNGYGWMAAPGTSEYISPNYFGCNPLPNYHGGPR